ncbi:hypothetical protein DFH09DRAFT_1312796 [Mycena vulgaris]|nr:hypothetical protein DFH09DRAFT_1312796 [Mycena vulgaris]
MSESAATWKRLGTRRAAPTFVFSDSYSPADHTRGAYPPGLNALSIRTYPRRYRVLPKAPQRTTCAQPVRILLPFFLFGRSIPMLILLRACTTCILPRRLYPRAHDNNALAMARARLLSRSFTDPLPPPSLRRSLFPVTLGLPTRTSPPAPIHVTLLRPGTMSEAALGSYTDQHMHMLYPLSFSHPRLYMQHHDRHTTAVDARSPFGKVAFFSGFQSPLSHASASDGRPAVDHDLFTVLYVRFLS